MAFDVRITPEAEQDADAILHWLMQEQAGEAGLRWFIRLQESIQSLASLPTRCKLAPETSKFSLEVRVLYFGRKPHVYRILFTIQHDTVYVLHIVHGRRLPVA